MNSASKFEDLLKYVCMLIEDYNDSSGERIELEIFRKGIKYFSDPSVKEKFSTGEDDRNFDN